MQSLFSYTSPDRTSLHFMIHAILVCLLASALAASAWSQTDIEILQADDRGCQFTLSTFSYDLHTSTEEGIFYSTIRLGSEWQTSSASGEPDIPFRNVFLALPVGADIRVTVDAADPIEWTDVRLRPVGTPAFGTDGMMRSVSFPEGERYAQDAWIPGRITETTSPSLFQDWNSAYVTIYPVQYHPVQRKLKLYRRVTVTVHFGEGKRNSTYRSLSSSEYQTARSVFLNHETAARLAVQPASALLRKSSNRLNAGTWLKIKITEEGIYKLDRKFFENQGINPSTIDPRTIKIYNNGGAVLPPLPPGLDFTDPSNPSGVSGLEFRENPVVVTGESDGKLDADDYVMFYGRGTRQWRWDPTRNKYLFDVNWFGEENIYWLTFNDQINGLRMNVDPSTTGNPVPQDFFRDYVHFEKDETNFYESGLLWVSSLLSPGQNAIYPASSDMPEGGLIHDPISEGTASYSIRFKGASNNSSSPNHRFSVTVNSQGPYTTPVFIYATARFLDFSIPIAQVGDGRISVTYNPPSAGGTAALDWFQIQYNRRLILNNDHVVVFSPTAAGNYEYTVDTRGANASSVRVWDITTPWSVRELAVNTGSDNVTFSDTVNAGRPKRYYVFSPSRLRSIPASQVSLDQNSDLQNPANSADYIILTPAAFKSEAERLAQHRTSFNGFRTIVVDIQDVFDEFAGGIPDPTAIRDFLRYAYYRWQTPPVNSRLSHVLLMGDGDYDYRNIIMKSNHNWIPTYQIHDDFVAEGYYLYNRQVDEAFAWLNDISLRWEYDDPYVFPDFLNYSADISIGRIPCNSFDEAAAGVTKTIVHETVGSLQGWQQTIGLVADDEYADGRSTELRLHTQPTENLASDTSMIPAFMTRDKIYLIDYPFEWAGSRRKKLLARDALIDRMNQGAQIINYVGHGNPNQLAHEEVYLHGRDFPLVGNKDKYFLFTNFSCSFAMFDQLEVQGGGEEMVVATDRGAYGLFAATRAVFADPNIQLMYWVFRHLKKTGIIGEAIRLGKISVGTTNRENHQKYNYLGDPATSVQYVSDNVQFNLSLPAVLTALGETTLSGYVGNQGSEADADFDGDMLITVFDRSQTRRYSTPYEYVDYTLETPVLYRGKTSVVNGNFTSTFIVPKDLSYSYERGSVIAYGTNGSTFAGGMSGQVIIDSTSGLVDDSTGPVIRVGFEGQSFTSGDVVPRNPVLNLQLRDTSGINVTGSMGHQIQLSIDDRFIYDLSDYFIYDVSSFRAGSIQVGLYNLEIGRHTARISAFDNANNASSSTFSFEIIDTEDDHRNQTRIQVNQLMNFPNPFRATTHFTFVVSHSAADVEITIYTISGRRIRRLEAQATFGFNSVPWDGRDEDGNRLANGVYLYRVKARSLDNASQSQSLGKLMIAK